MSSLRLLQLRTSRTQIDKDPVRDQRPAQGRTLKGAKQQGVNRVKNRLHQIYVRFKSERGQGGLIQFLIGAIVVAILLYVLLVIVKTLFFHS